MTKTISLADDAYDLLVAVRQPGESFSEVARRIARLALLDEVFDPDFKTDLPRGEADKWKADTYAARDREKKPRFDL